jgi:deoxyribodipyrimidine photolyase-related protein
MSTLRLILGDQLSASISSLADSHKTEDLVLMCEVYEEATYVKHHKKKIAFLFSAMRHFAHALSQDGYRLQYTKLDDDANTGSLLGEVKRILAAHEISRLVVTFPGEYRLLSEMQGWEAQLDIPVEIRPDDRFLCQPEEFSAWAADRKQLRMEFFYRDMRKKYAVLMEGDAPVGGKWNYDAENRKPPKQGLNIPPPYQNDIDPITQDVIDLVAARFDNHFGDLTPFHLGVTRAQALDALAHFIDQRLNQFGDYQDAMIEGEPWMYHAHIGFYLNCGLLLPRECIAAAEHAYHALGAPLNAVEGFIRQILGWREFVRGIYWLKMPDYAHENFFEAKRDLPDFYWTGDTKMNCLSQCVSETKQNAYAHHIQRLMVLGNFALITGLAPEQVNDWFLSVYADAYEWVEMPNVTGMVLFADGGVLASKPYAAGGSYINKMSNYCQNCAYKPATKNGPDACPFNYLYWDFLARNRDKLKGNHRMGMMFKTYERMDDEKKQAITQDADRFMESLA